ILLLIYSNLLFCQQGDYKLHIVQKNNSLGKEKFKDEFIKLNDSSEVIMALTNYLAQSYKNGYLNARFDSVSIDSITGNAFYYQGEKLKFGKINQGNIKEEALRKKNINLQNLYNKTFNSQLLNLLFKKIISYYENNGYPFAAVSLINLNLSEHLLNGELYLQEYGYYKIDSLIIKGDAEINEKLLRRYINIEYNEIYNESKIKNISKHINDIDFIEEAKPFELEFTENKANIYTYLKKRKANRINGILGIFPDENNNNKISITGEINLFLLNSFKKAEIIDINWRKLESSTQDFNLNFEYPYIFNTQFGFEGLYSLYKKDTSYFNNSFRFGVRYILYGNNFIKFYYQNKSNNLIGNQNEFNYNYQFGSSTSSLFGIGYFYNNLDYKYNPAKGIKINMNISTGKKKFKNTEKNTVNRTEIDINSAFYYPLIGKMVFNTKNITGIILDNELYENELYRIGGINNFRGIDEQSILASLYSIFSFELRYLFEKNSNIFIFSDWGYYERQTINKTSDSPFSFGVGLNLGTRSGIFSINYALPKQFDNPIELRAAKVHIGYSNRF
ncbi:MAG: hypothetical protein JXB17_10870, partial [Bacteroidales bacterium]|nr:hypothetical protein [Bacteroidales bacterium]